MDSPRMLKSHFPYFLLPDDLTKRKKGRVIYICRNPKAAVSSWYNLMKYLKNPPAPTLRDYFEMFLEGGKGVLFGPWGRHVREFWEHRNDGNILFLQFEHVIKDRRGAVKKIADFLGRVLAEEEIDKIMEHTTLEHMKKNNAVNYSYAEKLYQTDKSEGEFINTGSLDAWKHIVPEDLQRRVDKYIHQELGNTDLKFE